MPFSRDRHILSVPQPAPYYSDTQCGHARLPMSAPRRWHLTCAAGHNVTQQQHKIQLHVDVRSGGHPGPALEPFPALERPPAGIVRLRAPAEALLMSPTRRPPPRTAARTPARALLAPLPPRRTGVLS